MPTVCFSKIVDNIKFPVQDFQMSSGVYDEGSSW